MNSRLTINNFKLLGKDRSVRKQHNVVITGSTSGIGRSLAKQFILQGDNVIVTSRSTKKVDESCAYVTGNTNSNSNSNKIGKCYPFVADISNASDCKRLIKYSTDTFDNIDIWINNAGTNVFKSTPFHNFDESDCDTIVKTNLLGTVYCCKYIIPIMEKQDNGIIINFEGAGSNGLPTPNYSIYGATKSAITQFTRTLTTEYSNSNICICTISPGMVLTELLISDTDEHTRNVFNIFCENTDYIACFLVEKINKINSSCKIHYLTFYRIVWLLTLFQFRKYRHFDKNGNIINDNKP